MSRRSEFRIDRQAQEYYEWKIDRIPLTEGGFGIVCYFRDISTEVLAEEALRKAEKLAAVGRLASTISHEINNPLEAVTNILYLMQGEAAQNTMLATYLRTAEEELRRASEVVHYSLKFHRESKRPQPESIAALLRSTLTVFDMRLKQADVRVDADLRDTRAVLCHGGEVRQVFANLITNAIDAIATYGVLAIRSRDGRNWQTGEFGVTVTILDNGVGMDSDTQQKIYDAFYTTKGASGSGLGLWLTCEIMARHNGRIVVKSRPHVGTTFRLFLPMREERRRV